MARFLSVLMLLCLTSFATAHAQTLTVHNKTNFDLYAATYYFKNTADRFSEVFVIPEGGSATFAHMPLKFAGPRRKLVFSINKDDLKPRLTSSEYHILGHMSVGAGKEFYISAESGSFKGYNYLQWRASHLFSQTIGVINKKVDEVILGQIRRSAIKDPAFDSIRNVQVRVRESTSIPDQEKAYLLAREAKVREAIGKLTGKTPLSGSTPKIGMCESGGGYRAMLGSLGSLQGAQQSGLLSATTYVSALSGSTWTLGPWLASGWTLDELRIRLIEKVKTDFLRVPFSLSEITKNLLMRTAFHQPITALNLYAKILANNLLRDVPGGPFDLYIHQQADRIKSGDWIFPIYTTVTTKLPYQWIEFTPYEVGSDYLGGYIPVWAFGAPFVHGEMKYFTPPYSLPYVLAICGSAFSARLSQIAEMAAKKIPFESIRDALTDKAQEVVVGRTRASAAQIYNWTYGMHPLPRAQQEIIKVIDGGISYNLGLEALLRRNTDIIIINDFSASDNVGGELKKAETDLRARGFALPPINYDNIDKRRFSVFKDSTRSDVPTIIYIPFAQELRPCLDSWCGTFTFKYSGDDANTLIDESKKAMLDAAPTIANIIKEWVDSHP